MLVLYMTVFASFHLVISELSMCPESTPTIPLCPAVLPMYLNGYLLQNVKDVVI